MDEERIRKENRDRFVDEVAAGVIKDGLGEEDKKDVCDDPFGFACHLP